MNKHNLNIVEMIRLGFLFLLFFVGCSCSESKKSNTTEVKKLKLKYNLTAPDRRIELPSELEEISGLFFWEKGYLGAVQDESGILYKIKISNGKVIDQILFGKDGDYEGITRVGDMFYALKSNGDLFYFSETTEATKIETILSKNNNCEGLCYQPDNNQLLVACKGNPGNDAYPIDEGKGIYAFDPITRQVANPPYAVVLPSDLKKKNPEIKKKVYKNFSPSGIAVHPKTKNIYVLAHQGSLLVVLSSDAKLLGTFSLSSLLFVQPEGICFGNNGELYISNESGGEGLATILVFNEQKH